MSTFLLFFGKTPLLSLAEAQRVLGWLAPDAQLQQLTAGIAQLHGYTGSATALQERLGGTTKVAEALWHGPADGAEGVLLQDMVGAGKLPVLISWYGAVPPLQQQAKLASRLKDKAAAAGTRLRLANSHDEHGAATNPTPAHSRSVLAEGGREYALVRLGSDITVARTVAVTDADGYAHRDRNRPVADAHNGMLPPALARIMVNLAGAQPGATVVDPFCGSGTLATEALLAGHPVIAADISHDQADATIANTGWLAAEHPGLPSCKVAAVDATTTDYTKLPKGTVIATEGYLGDPQRIASNGAPGAIAETEDLWTAFFRAALPAGLPCVVVSMPFYQLRDDEPTIFLQKALATAKELGYDPARIVDADAVLAHQADRHHLAHRGSFLYRRPSQRVGREVFVFVPRR